MSGPPAQEQNCTDGVDNDEDGNGDCVDHFACAVARYGTPY